MIKRFKINFVFPIIVIVLVVSASSSAVAQDEKDTKIYQLQANLRLYDEALNELQAPTPEETALVYAKGVKTRNGVMQYSVLSNRLKEQFKKNMDRDIWVTGVSSPWVSGYKIISNKKAAGVSRITLRFNLDTSTGSAGSTKNELTIAKENGKWRIININQ